uniref:PDZ binding kinase n=1 Tax=Cyprinus carpio TaxID=7962 RepID=A0A8C1GG60_CYPCA
MEANKESPSAFKTPCKPAKVKNPVSACGTPVTIPASPFMKKLGCGTGVNLKHLYQQQVCKDLKRPSSPQYCFRAFTTAKDGSKCLAMEYGGEQSLNDLIERRREEGLQAFPVATIEKVALHVARGLQYLHNEKKLLHGDMKSCNVVIKGDFEGIKICDVGVSLPLDENMQVSDPKAHYIGTEPWNPKEALEDGVISDKADIFAYGLTLWEMMTLAVPHLEMLDTEGDDDDNSFEDDFDEDAYYERLGTRPALDAATLGGAYQRMVELFCLCTEEDPHKRPSAAHIVQVLESNTQLCDKSSEVIIVD